MKYAIVSDIHGNLAALKAALADARVRGCEKFVCLGDLTGYGDEAVACVELARKEQILFVGHTHVPVIMAMGPESVRLSRSFDEQEMLTGMRGLKALTKTSGLIKPGVRYVVNVGSVGRPREGSLPTYATLDDAMRRIELVTLR